MDRTTYLAEVEKRIKSVFSQSRNGHKVSSVDRHRLEGFMHAGVFMEMATIEEMSSLMETVHQSVFGKSIQQRKTESPVIWEADSVDYSTYESPAYKR